MGYVKQTWDASTWAKGQTYLQNQLNHMETGIEQGGSGAGKNWYTLELSQSDVESIINGEEIVHTLSSAYNPETFKSDYFW